MKKVVSVVALVVALVMMSMTTFAAASFELAEDAVIPEGTTVTPAADSISVSTGSTAGAYYGILLVEGSELPTVDSDILYINQETATGTAVDFSVLPILPEAGTELTLYISSSVEGAGLIPVSLVYAEGASTNDYITTADTAKGTIKVDVASVTNASMGAAVGNRVVQLALDTTAYPAAGAATAGYIVKAVNADGSDISGSNVYYSAERTKYVALIPTATTDYKFEVIANGTEGATANAVIKNYGDMNETGGLTFNAIDLGQFRNVYKKATNSVAKTDAKKALIADVSGDGNVNAVDLGQFRKAYKKDPSYNFAVLGK